MLTSKQEAFCQSVVSGNSLSDAYRIAYDVATMKDATVNREATKLQDNHKITTRLLTLRAELAERGLWSREDSIKAMTEIIADPDNQSCKISAVKVINEMQGFNAPVKTESTGTINVNIKINGR